MKKPILSSFLISIILSAVMAAPAMGAIVLHYAGGPPVLDTDVLGLADITAPIDPFSFDIVYDDFAGTDFSGGMPGILSGFTIGIADPAEILPDGALPGSYIFDPFGTGIVSLGSALAVGSISQEYFPVAPLIPGTVIASFSVTPGALELVPGDETPDLTLVGITPSGFPPISVFDPGLGGFGAPGAAVGYDAQVVPLPAAAWLFASALGIFGFLGKKKVSK